MLLNQRIKHGRFPAANPVANALMAIVGVLVVGVAIVFGLFVFMLLAGIFAVLAAIVGIRIWWVARKLRKLHDTAAKAPGASASGAGIIEGEYHVVSTRRERRGE